MSVLIPKDIDVLSIDLTEHDKVIRAEVIDEALSKVRNLVNIECNPNCECQPDCLYLEAIGDTVEILKQLKERNEY